MGIGDGDGKEVDEVASKDKAPAKSEAVGEPAKKKRQKGERTGEKPNKRQSRRYKTQSLMSHGHTFRVYRPSAVLTSSEATLLAQAGEMSSSAAQERHWSGHTHTHC